MRDKNYWTEDNIKHLSEDMKKFARAFAAGRTIEVKDVLGEWIAYSEYCFNASSSSYRIVDEYFLTKNSDGVCHLFKNKPRTDKPYENWFISGGPEFSYLEIEKFVNLIPINNGECLPVKIITHNDNTTIVVDNKNKITLDSYKPQYRPWTFEDRGLIPGKIKSKISGHIYEVTNIGLNFISSINYNFKYEDLLNDFEQLDGSPCGIQLT